jgi:predicted enzyme related to lactoylglutathione lyase
MQPQSSTGRFANKQEGKTMSNADIRGKFIWHELLTSDTAGAAAFYPKVLPWRSQPSSMPGYTLWMAGQAQVGGLMALPADSAGTPPHWLIYVGTPNVDATAEHAQRLGAKVWKAATDIPNVGRFAVLADPQGATFALFTPAPDGTGGPAAPGPGVFSWHELATTDVAGALRFYGELFGWSKGPGHDMGAMGVYQIFERFGSMVGGMCNVQGPATPPSWLSYVEVPDSARAVAAAKAAGGRLLHGPVEVPGGSWIALFLDPQGGAFAVQEPARAAAKPVAPAAKPAAAAPKPAPAAAPPPKPAAPPAPAKPAPAPAAAPPAARAAAAKPAKAKKPVKKKAGKKAAKKAVKKKAAKPARRKAARKAPRKAAKKVARRAKARRHR